MNVVGEGVSSSDAGHDDMRGRMVSTHIIEVGSLIRRRRAALAISPKRAGLILLCAIECDAENETTSETWIEIDRKVLRTLEEVFEASAKRQDRSAAVT